MLRTLAIVLAWSIGIGCAGTHPGQVPKTESNLITRAELDAVGTGTLYDAIVRLRPAFLRDRGPTSVMVGTAQTRAAVFYNDAEYGGIESLQRFQAMRVQEVRFYPGPEAVTRFGSGYGAGVIAVKPRLN